MSKEALRDAFMAGWGHALTHRGKSQVLAENHFEAWYRQSVNTGNRVDVAAVWIDEYPAIAAMDFAQVEERLLGTTNRELLKQEIGKRATNMLLNDDPTEKDRRINQALGYPLYQEGQPLAPGQQYICEHDWRSAANGGSQCRKCAVYKREFGTPDAGGTEYRFPRGKRKGKK